MTFSAVRSRFRSDETATSVCTSAGLKGYRLRRVQDNGSQLAECA